MNLKDVQADLLRRGAWLTVQWQNSGWSVALVAVSNSRHCGFGDAPADVVKQLRNLASAIETFDGSWGET